ncbi:MAG: DUF429 domain-containing protein [Chloroflexi bacterium]|nr:DUF429 domain-containing protein [Chloroflexota bacterium]
MDLSSRKVYGAAGASLIAAAVTARYVARWRRRRSLQRAGQDDRPSGGRFVIGLDLADPYAAKKRRCDVAVVDPDLHCTFDNWVFDEGGSGIIPSRALGRSFILAIDGPQGLAGERDATMRHSERLVNAPGHTPYDFPGDGRPYAGLITASVKLFYRLVTSGGRFRLLGLDGVPPSDANLMEVFPGAAWRKAAERRLPAKRTEEGRAARYELLQQLGLTFDVGGLPTDDQLDAAMAAWVAHRFDFEDVRIEGQAPELDEAAGVIREGYIVQPAPAADRGAGDAGTVAPV